MLVRIPAVAVAVALVLTASVAGAQDVYGFGGPGQVAISSDFSTQIGIHSEIAPDGNNPSSTTTVMLAPAADVFVAQNFSVGGQMLLSWQRSGSRDMTGLGIGPRVGYDVPIADKFSFWPKGGVVYMGWNAEDFSGARLTAFVYAPFLFHPAPHFFVGFGPWFDMDLWSRWRGEAANRNLDLALTATVGGWF